MVAKQLKLNSGHTIPTVGLGVYKTPPGNETYGAVMSALKLGYRHIDTAQVYGNEADVGRAVRECGVPRDQIFVTSKLWRSEYGYDKALASIKQSLATMGLDYLDMLLLHAPGDAHTRPETWRAMEYAVGQGLLRSIGVSNFGPQHIDKLLTTATFPPAVNQVEITPFLQRTELVSYCRSKHIVVEAYSPLAKGSRMQDERLGRIAARLDVTPAQVLIRWSLQHGLVPLPKSVNPERQAANLDVYGFALDDEAMALLDGLEEGLVTGWDPISNDPV